MVSRSITFDKGCLLEPGKKLDGDMGEIVSLQDQTSLCSETKEPSLTI